MRSFSHYCAWQNAQQVQWMQAGVDASISKLSVHSVVESDKDVYQVLHPLPFYS